MMEQETCESLIQKGMASPGKALSEKDAKKIFAAFDIPMVKDAWVASPDDAGAAAEKFGFPVVLKGAGENLLHKTEANLVHLGLGSREEVGKAARGMLERSGDALDGFLVQPMVQGTRELVVGMFKDAQFGPVIMFGLGGVLTEALQDIVFKVAPLTEVDMDDMFEQLGAQKLLGPFRGEAAVDLQDLKRILKGVSDLVIQYPDIREVDINPVVIGPDGKGTAVDGLIVFDEKSASPTPRHPVDISALGQCFYPRSIAFVGASSSIGKWGYLLPLNALSRPYGGDIFMVNPKGGRILGRTAHPSLGDIPGDVDLAVVSIPAQGVMGLIPQLVEKKVKGVLLITSGFKEVGDEGAHLEADLTHAFREAGILLLGPNTMGMCNPHMDLFCNASHAYPIAGSTALVCQSGNMGTQLLCFAEQQGIGIRAFSGSGNEAMVTIEDYLDAFERDELTRTLVLYIESIKDGKRFFESSRRVSKKKPVVVLKGGRTEEGGRAAASHTGAMASNTHVFDAACTQAGVIQVDQPMELLDLSMVFSSLPLPRGNRVAIMTLGGGWGVIATDLCAEYGLEVPELPRDIIERLNGILPDFWSHGNPVDLVGENDPSIPRSGLEELLKWDGCDAVLHLGIHGKRPLANRLLRSAGFTDEAMDKDTEAFLRETAISHEEEYTRYVIEMTQKYKKPVLGVSLLTDSESRTLYREDGFEYKGVFFPSPERAVKSLAAMCRYQQWRSRHGDN